MERDTKTMAKQSRVGPRTQVVSTMKICFWGEYHRQFKKSRKNEKLVVEGAPALRSIRAGIRLTVYRALP